MKDLWSGRAIALLVLILLAAAAVRVYSFSGYVGLDDAEYARLADALTTGRDVTTGYRGPAVFPLRFAAYVPTAASFKFFGVSEWTMVLYPFIVSLVSIVLIYIAAALFFGWQAGLLSAALLSAFYWDINSATKLLPDLPAGAFALAGIVLLVYLDRQTPERKSSLIAGGAVAGLTFGLSWLAKETIAYLAPFTLALIFLTVTRTSEPQSRRMRLVWAGFIAGSGLVLLGECAAYYFTTGDALFRVHEIERNYRQWENGFFSEGSNMGWAQGTAYTQALMNRLFVGGPATLLLEPSLYYLTLIGIAAAAYGWWRNDRAYTIPALWLITLLVAFNFASSSTTEYIPLSLYHRYLYPVYYPAIILVGGLLAKLVFTEPLSLKPQRLVELGSATAVSLLILWAAVPTLYFNVLVRPTSWTEEVRMFKDSVHPDSALYADALTLRAFEFFTGYPTKTSWIGFEQIASGADIPVGSTVIVNKRYIDWLNRNAGMWVAWPSPGPTERSGYRRHDFYNAAPDTWNEVWKDDNASIYKVGAEPQHTGSAQ
jgi:4-amino-4-deoxy-L-arabinose transferase-like glycosyltransferase